MIPKGIDTVSIVSLLFRTTTFSKCVFKHSATVNQRRMCSSPRERWQNDDIFTNSNNYLFKRAIQLPQLATGCQILNIFQVNRWLLHSTTQLPQLAAVSLHERLCCWCSFSNGITVIQSFV